MRLPHMFLKAESQPELFITEMARVQPNLFDGNRDMSRDGVHNFRVLGAPQMIPHPLTG